MRNTVSLQQGYSLMFREYPDVVDVPAMREMLGGIGRRSAYALLKSGEVESVKIGRIYRIPKLGVIAYLCKSSRAAEEPAVPFRSKPSNAGTGCENTEKLSRELSAATRRRT